MKIIILNGYPQSGKDSFCCCCNNFAKIRVISTVTPIKILLEKLGWNGEKTPQVRKLLSDLKDFTTHTIDLSFNYVNLEVEKCNNDNYEIVAIMSREPDEIARFVEYFSNYFDVCTVFISRNDHEKQLNCDSDKNVEQYNYDFYIDNNGTITDLKNTAENFLKQIGVLGKEKQ